MESSHSTLLSCDDMSIDDYFDFDAASCDLKSTATGWEFRHISKAPSSMNFDESLLERLVLDRDALYDAYQFKLDVAGIYSDTIPTAQYAWDNFKACELSNSDLSDSGPSSPSSYLSILSPPHSPISCGADNDTGCWEENASITSLLHPSPTPYTLHNEVATSAFHREASPTPPFFDSSSHPLTFVHAPRLVSPRRDVVEGLENIVQPPVEIAQALESTCCSDSSPGMDQLQIIHLDDDPPRSPSPCENAGPVHRVGKPKKKGRKRVVCPYPNCGQTFTRRPDLPRHKELKHNRQSPVKIYSDTGKDRKWCMGCLTILSRADSRRRHEKHCPHLAEYLQFKIRSVLIPPLLEIFSEHNDDYRLYCSTCYETFPNPVARHAHEVLCVPPLAYPNRNFTYDANLSGSPFAALACAI
ncbi:hypothetical protein B0H19DRAFT_1068601 [Mycena capillaripes]|nr:hypothetical protein B0H19DRAFT_1068601 [Mycena capillaripes]